MGRIFGASGYACEVAEELMDAVTALSGSGPAYIFEMIQAMVNGAVTVGLPQDLALRLAVQTVAGAAEMLCQELGSPDELRMAVTSPGGTTAAGLGVMAEADFRGVIARTIRAARDRSVELGKGEPRHGAPRSLHHCVIDPATLGPFWAQRHEGTGVDTASLGLGTGTKAHGVGR